MTVLAEHIADTVSTPCHRTVPFLLRERQMKKKTKS